MQLCTRYSETFYELGTDKKLRKREESKYVLIFFQ